MASTRLLLVPGDAWFPLDDLESLDDNQRSLLAAMQAAGLGLDVPDPAGLRRLGVLGMYNPALDPKNAPLVAVLLAYRTVDRVNAPGRWRVTRNPEGYVEVTPERQVEIREHQLPLSGDLFRMLHVRYLLPSPDGRVVILEYSSPNLPEQALLEWEFDQVTARVRFVEDAPVDTAEPVDPADPPAPDASAS